MELFFSNTNVELIERGYKPLSGYSEAIKFQGIMRLCTWFLIERNCGPLLATTNLLILPVARKRIWFVISSDKSLLASVIRNNHRNDRRVSCWSKTDGCFLLTIMFLVQQKLCQNYHSVRNNCCLQKYLLFVRYWRRLDQPRVAYEYCN